MKINTFLIGLFTNVHNDFYYLQFRYFAGDSSMKAISYYFLRGETTVRNIIENTSEALWTVLQPIYIYEKAIKRDVEYYI